MSDLLAAGLESMLAPYSDRVRVRARHPEARCDVVLTDPSSIRTLPPEELTSWKRRRESATWVVCYSADPATRNVEALLRAWPGPVRGWLSCTRRAAELVGALELICRGEIVIDGPMSQSVPVSDRDTPLTQREAQVLVLIAGGLSNQQIVEELQLSGNTVKSYIRHAYRKIGFTSRSRAVLWGAEVGVLGRVDGFGLRRCLPKP